MAGSSPAKTKLDYLDRYFWRYLMPLKYNLLVARGIAVGARNVHFSLTCNFLEQEK
jgi:hypothetical protein